MIQQRLRMVLSENELARIKILESDSFIRIHVDVHGLSCKQARLLIKNVILIPRSDFLLMVIHGFNRGTAIKSMLADSFENDHIKSRSFDPANQGVTYMKIAA